MRFGFFIVFASITSSVCAQNPAVMVATNPERASGFKGLTDCQKNIAATRERDAMVRNGKPNTGQGTVFNRTHGNITRCEMVEGEAMVVVYPRGHGALAQ